MRPVIKWAGGKNSILHDVLSVINRYPVNKLYEPFVGGGSVFLALEAEKLVINDLNAELIMFYKEVKRDPEGLIKLLEEHKSKHCKEHFYHVRSLDRDGTIEKMSDQEKAARFAYLNRTCYNGLYRVNAKNQFNTPMGRYENRELVYADEIRELSKYFNCNDVQIMNVDFEKAVSDAKEGDVVYFDPPYDYEDNVEGFARYTPAQFGREETLRLRDLCNKLRKKGCHVVVSNNDTQYIRDIFSDWNFKELEAPRYINCKRDRKKAKELIIYE